MPRSYAKNIERMRMGHKIKQMEKAIKEHIPKGENLKYYKNLPENIPNCYKRHLQKPKKKSSSNEDILYFDINIGNGKTGKLGLRKRDNALVKANVFAKIFGLNEEMEEALGDMLIGYQTQRFQNYSDEYQTNIGENDLSELDHSDHELQNYYSGK